MGAVERYEEALFRYARRLIGDLDLAHDAVQHTFLKLCGESKEAIDHRLGPWLFAVCRNRAIDHLRRGGRERPMGDAPRQGPKSPETTLASDRAMPASREADPAVAAEAHDLATRLHLLLAELPPAQAEAIELWCQGFSYRQIGEITGRQEGNVRVLAHRGLTKLRAHPLVRSLLADLPQPRLPHTQEVIR
jgi:RNA polymerase sigma-70 factor (ECF subfamily)